MHSRLINQLLKQVIFCTIKHYLLISDARNEDSDARGDEVYSTFSVQKVISSFTFIFLFCFLSVFACFILFLFCLCSTLFILRASLAIYLFIYSSSLVLLNLLPGDAATHSHILVLLIAELD